VETRRQRRLREQQEALLQAIQQGHPLLPINPAVLLQQLQGMQNQLPVNPPGPQQPPASRVQAGAAAQVGAHEEQLPQEGHRQVLEPKQEQDKGQVDQMGMQVGDQE